MPYCRLCSLVTIGNRNDIISILSTVGGEQYERRSLKRAGRSESRFWRGAGSPQDLAGAGVVTAEYVQRKREIAEELRADINASLFNRLEAREREDREHFGKMRANNEASLKAP